MKTILPFSKFLAFVFLITNLLFANVFFGQTVTLDQADLDYAPGETVYITGTGWHSGETVALQVDNLTNPDVDCGPVTPQPHELWTVVADENGNFTASWYVNDCELDADLMLGAYGENSGFTYELFFTDSNDKFQTSGLPSGIVVNVTATYTKPNGDIVNNETVTFNSPGPSGSIGVKQNTQVVYSFPLSIISGGITYNLISSTPSSGYTNTNTAQVVTGEYIGCAAPLFSNQPENQNLTYGNNASFSAVANGTATLSYQWQEDSGSGFSNISDGGVYSGTTTATLTLTRPSVAMSTNKYRCVVTNACGSVNSNGSATLTVNKKDITVSVNAGQNKVYGSLDPVFIYTPSEVLLSGNSFTGALGRVLGENVNTYAYALGTLSAGANYNITLTGSNTFAILPKLATVTANAKSKTYGDGNPALDAVVSGTVNGDVLSFTLETSVTQFSGVGNYPIEVLLGANPNYSVTPTNALLTIGLRSVEITADAKSKTYGEADPLLTYQISSGSLVTGDSFSGSLSRDAGENVGNYAITQGSVALNSNYTLTYVGANLTIDLRSVEITADAKSKTYGEADPLLTYQISSGSLAFSDSFSGSLSRDAGENVGDYAITQGSVALNSNYTLTYVGANLTIDLRSVEITADAKSKTYGEADPLLTYQISSGSLAFSDSFSGSLSRDAGENVGNYAITQGSVALNSNYTLTYVGANLTIDLRSVEITADAKSKTYGEADPLLTYEISSGSLVTGDSFSGSLSRDAGENVGDYAITQGSVALNSNYTLTYVGANLTIGKRAITITADAKFKCFGVSDPGLTAQLTSGSIISGDTVSGELERNSGESAGVYAINKGTYTYGNNYNETYVSASLTINSQIAVTFTRTNPNHYFGLSGDQTSKITVIPSGGIGPYTVTITMDRSLISNYINSSGDESWIPDPTTMPATTSSYNIVLPSSGSNTQGNPYTIATGVQTTVGYSIKVGLIDDAGFTATITDSKGCTITTEKIFIHGEDVRCFAGKSGVAKVKLCHRTGNARNPCQELCVDESAVAAHLAHGDFLGTCTPNCVAPQTLSKDAVSDKEKLVEEEIKPFDIIAYPNPSNYQFTLEIKNGSQEKTELLIYDMSARLVKRIEKENGQNILFGENLPSGEYLLLVRQGENRESVNVIKK